MPRWSHGLGRWLSWLIVPCAAASIAPRSIAQVSTASAPLPSTSTSAPATTPGPSPETIAEAKRFFEAGETYRANGQWVAALDAYLRSHALVPRASNTLNVAVCLYELERYDEALDYYEEALTRYPESQLSPASRADAKKQIAEIEPKTGRLDISSNVDGQLVIDGRPRGKLPLPAPVRVMPGKHLVRVVFDGYATFEKQVEVKAASTTPLEAKLEALTSSGRLRVEGEGIDGAQVTVDGAQVGTAPWEGTLGPGPHVVIVVSGDVGTAPKLANVVAGQTVSLRVALSALSGERRIVVDPPSAALTIDGVRLGTGGFQGRLPRGLHELQADEEGYLPLRLSSDWSTAGPDIQLKLVVDPSHPRWNAGKRAIIGVELLAGYGFSSSLGNDSSSYCAGASSCTQTSAPSGVHLGVVGYYELPMGLQIVVQAGYFSLHRTMSRSFDTSYTDVITTRTIPLSYAYADDVSIKAPYATAGVGYRLSLGAFDVVFRTTVGASLVSASDTLTGTGSGGGRTLGLTTAGSGNVQHGVAAMIVPEASFGYLIGKIRVALGLRAPITLTDGPSFRLGQSAVQGGACPPNDRIDCAPLTSFNSGLKSFSRFPTWVPVLSVGYRF